MFNRTRVGAGIAIAMLVLTGCGGDDEEAVTAAAGDTTTDVDPQEDPGAYFEAVAAATKEAGSHRVEVSLAGAAAAVQSADMSGLVVYDGDDLLLELVPAGEEPSTIQTADALYRQGMPGLPTELFDRKWIVTEFSSAGVPGQGMSSPLLGTTDPEVFTNIGDDVEVSVDEGGEVDGVSTQKISFTLPDDFRLPGTSDDDSPAGFGESQLQGTAFEITVGDDLLIREVSSGPPGVMVTNASMYDYGLDETIEAPADEDTITMVEVGDMIRDNPEYVPDEIRDVVESPDGAPGAEG